VSSHVSLIPPSTRCVCGNPSDWTAIKLSYHFHSTTLQLIDTETETCDCTGTASSQTTQVKKTESNTIERNETRCSSKCTKIDNCCSVRVRPIRWTLQARILWTEIWYLYRGDIFIRNDQRGPRRLICRHDLVPLRQRQPRSCFAIGSGDLRLKYQVVKCTTLQRQMTYIRLKEKQRR